jgi:hypothetical protein
MTTNNIYTSIFQQVKEIMNLYANVCINEK